MLAWLASLIGGPIVNGLIDGYKAKLDAANKSVGRVSLRNFAAYAGAVHWSSRTGCVYSIAPTVDRNDSEGCRLPRAEAGGVDHQELQVLDWPNFS